MLRHSRAFFSLLLVWLGFAALPISAQQPSAGDDLEGLLEKAMKAAVARVAPAVVQIETSGGSDILMTGSGPTSQPIRKAAGPTTGLIVASDGYIVSSAFNFANKPSAIFVAIPGQKERLVAKVIATDTTRMVTLLKVEATGLPVPAATPKKEIQVGQWTLALGRALAGLDTPPTVSTGIVSAVGRIWGRAIQTDAKVSPVNYGGPLVDLQGRVMGVLVPASPRGEDETAGLEWYDSGIGFAIPLEDVNAVLPKLKQGKDLKKGLLGIRLQSTDIYGATPIIGTVDPDSPAARAGIKSGDTVTEINGVRVVRQAQILHILGEKYEGDTVSVKVLREKNELSFQNLVLASTSKAHAQPFLGVLPMRDDPELGEELRYVFPKSPAEAAGLKVGDRIMKVTVPNVPAIPFSGRDELTAVLDQIPPGTELQLDVVRKESKKTETLKLTLGVMPDTVPDSLPEAASYKKALAPRKQAQPVPQPRLPQGKPPQGKPPMPPPKEEKKEDKDKEKKKVETGLLKRATPARDHEYWLYVPEDYDPNISYALVVWLHPAGKGKDKETEAVISTWDDFCNENHMILLCPRAEAETGWVASESEFILQTIRDVEAEYTIDRQRIVAHGMGVGGQMAFYLAMHARNVIRGVATVGAMLNSPLKDNLAQQRQAFFIVAGGKDPVAKAIEETKTKLVEHKFPVVYHEVPEMGAEYFDGVILRDLILWIDSLDRQ
jgi:S1-C subfamily serine protease/predicted esterase